MSRMKYIVLWIMLAAGFSAQAITIDFRHAGSSTNGYYHWNDPANWNPADVPGGGDLVRFGRTAPEAKVYLDGNAGVQTLQVYTNTEIVGTGTITVAGGNMTFQAGPNAALTLRDSVRMTVGSDNDIIMNGVKPTLTLYDSARVEAGLRFNAGAQFTITLNGNSVFDNQGTPNSASNIAAGSKFELNDSSSMIMSTLTAQELNTGWLGYNTVLYLNDTASIILESNAANAANIASFIASGKILINGSPTAQAGTDYTYENGKLSAIVKTAESGFAFLVQSVSSSSDIVLFDFENETALEGWRNEGAAFNAVAKNAPYHGQVSVQNVQKERFLYSFDTQKLSNNPVGSLISPTFTIEKDYINFILGGGRGWPERLGVQLMVGDEIVRSATGRESSTGRSFKMINLNWDVKAYKGQTACLIFNDNTPYGTLGADCFVQSDTAKGYRCDATKRFAEMYRPAFHATVGRGRSGDADGMFYYNGQWFQGYQFHYVDSSGWGWGYSVSRDLVHWTVRGEMVSAGVTGQASTGGALVDWNNISGLKNSEHPPILLSYTVRPIGAGSSFPDTPASKLPKAEDIRLYPAFTYSTDGGDTWTKDLTPLFQYGNPEMLTFDTGNQYTLDGGKTWTNDPSLLLGDGGFAKDRDAKCFFYEPTGDWIMIWHLSQNNQRDRSAFGLYRSKDFKKWELFQTIPGMWECPDMFELPAVGRDGMPTGKKYWIVSRGGVEYFIGTFDGNEFRPLSANDPSNPYEVYSFYDPDYSQTRCLRRVTHKSGCYAAQTFANAPDGRRIQVSWLSLGEADHAPGSPFECVMSFPVELTLRDTGGGLHLEHVPVKEIEAVYSRTQTHSTWTLPEGTTPPPEKLASNLLDVEVTFSVGNASSFGLSVLGERIIYNVHEQKLYAFREYVEDDVWREKSALVQLEDGKLKLRILVDRCSVEVGIQGGVNRTTMLVYPQQDDPGLSFISEGGSAVVESLRISEIECEQASSNTPDKYREI